MKKQPKTVHQTEELEIEIISKNNMQESWDNLKIIKSQAQNIFKKANKIIKQRKITEKQIIKLEIKYNDNIMSADSLFFHYARIFQFAQPNGKEYFVKDYSLELNNCIKIVIKTIKRL